MFYLPHRDLPAEPFDAGAPLLGRLTAFEAAEQTFHAPREVPPSSFRPRKSLFQKGEPFG
jgi:hypothetical protein